MQHYLGTNPGGTRQYYYGDYRYRAYYPWPRRELLSVLKAWVRLFLVKIDMLSCWLHFSNTQQSVGTIYILWIEVCLVIKKKVATFWKTAHVSKRTANGKLQPAFTWAQKAQHLDITNHGLSRLHNKLLT